MINGLLNIVGTTAILAALIVFSRTRSSTLSRECRYTLLAVLSLIFLNHICNLLGNFLEYRQLAPFADYAKVFIPILWCFLLYSYVRENTIRQLFKNEQMLQESEERYRILAESSPVGIWHLTPDGRTLYANRAMCQLLEIASVEEILDVKCEVFYTEESQKIIQTELSKRQDRISSTYEVELLSKKGNKRNVLIYGSPLFSPDGQLRALIGTIVDITERKRATEALHRSQEQYHSLFNTMLDGFALFDVIIDDRGEPIDFRYVEANPSYEHLLNVQMEVAAGKTIHEMHSTLEREWLDACKEVMRTGIFLRKEGFVQNLNKFLDVLFYIPAPAKMAVLVRDITEKKNLEDQLRHSFKMKAIGQLAGGVAHDFNNILMAILGYSDLALSQIEENNPLHRQITEIKQAGGRAASLTQQLLAFSRKQVLKPIALNLNDMIMDLNLMLQRVIGEHVELIFLAEPNLDFVMVDPGQVQQVILNLVVNSRDAMPLGGKIVIETQNVVLDDQYAKNHVNVKAGRYVLLSLSDTGCGIHPDILPQIFEPFFTTKSAGKGTGLGLSTVYGIIQQSNGYIFVHSEIEIGTTFKIYLPRTDAPKKTKMEPNPPIHDATGSETILVVEDDGVVRQLIIRSLRENGYQVLEARNGKEALHSLEKYQRDFDLLVTDVIMPEMTGPQLHEELKKYGKDPCVLYISGYTNNAIVHQGILENELQFLHKPFSTKELLRKIRLILDEKRVGDAKIV